MEFPESISFLSFRRGKILDIYKAKTLNVRSELQESLLLNKSIVYNIVAKSSGAFEKVQ